MSACRLAMLLALPFALAGCSGGSPEPAPIAPPPARLNAAPQPAGVSLPQASPPAKAEPVAAIPATASESPVSDSGRPWRDVSGNILARGEFLLVQDGNICLDSGAVVPIDQLGEEDRRYVLKQPGASTAASQPPSIDAGPAEPVAKSPQAPSPAAPEEPASPPRTQKAVVPFDFVSKFDNGVYGQKVGDMIYKRLERQGVFLIPGSMADVRDVYSANGLSIGPDTPLEKVKDAVQKLFNSDIGIWGSMERVPGNQWDVYDFTIRCVDFTEPEPKVIYEKIGVRTKVVSEVPDIYVKEMFDKLYDREPERGPVVSQVAEANWARNPNLVPGGDFQKGAGGVPDGWEKGGGQDREPLGRLVSWVGEEGNPENKLIRLSFDKDVGNSYGVMYYSRPFPVEEGATYRFQCRYRTNGPSVKVFIKCYDQMSSEYKAQSTEAEPQSASAATGPGEYVAGLGQLREVYRSQQNLDGPKNAWNTQTEDFTPKHQKYVPRWGRVMLYGYKGAGVVDFDDVVVKQVVPASPSASKKVLRHSSQSSVTLEEMRAADQQSQEPAEQKPAEKKQGSGGAREKGSKGEGEKGTKP